MGHLCLLLHWVFEEVGGTSRTFLCHSGFNSSTERRGAAPLCSFESLSDFELSFFLGPTVVRKPPVVAKLVGRKNGWFSCFECFAMLLAFWKGRIFQRLFVVSGRGLLAFSSGAHLVAIRRV